MKRKITISDLLSQAQEQTNRSNYLAAFNIYKNALKLIDPEIGSIHELPLLMSIGDTGRMTGNFKDSLTYYQRAITLAQSAHNLELSADAQVGLGLSKRALGYWREALDVLTIAEDFYRNNNDHEGLAFCHWAAAGTYRIKGDIPECIRIFSEALEEFSLLDDQSGASYCMCGLGGANRMIGKYEESLLYYKRANEEFSRLSDRFGTAYSYCGIGNANRMTGKYDISMEYLKKATAVYKEIGDIVSSAYTLWSIGMIYLINKKYGYCERFFNNASDYFKKTGDVRGDVYIGLGICQLEFLKDNSKLALEILSAAEKTAKKYSFGLEYCYALRIAQIIKGEDGNIPLNIP